MALPIALPIAVSVSVITSLEIWPMAITVAKIMAMLMAAPIGCACYMFLYLHVL